MSRQDAHPASTRWRRSTGNRFRQQFLDFLGIRASAQQNSRAAFWREAREAAFRARPQLTIIGGYLVDLGFGSSKFSGFPVEFPLCLSPWPREFRSNGCGDVCGIDLVPPCCACEVGVLLKRLPRVVAGAIDVRNKSAHYEKPIEVCSGNGLYGSRRNLLVVHGLSTPRGFGLLLLPSVELGETA